MHAREFKDVSIIEPMNTNELIGSIQTSISDVKNSLSAYNTTFMNLEKFLDSGVIQNLNSTISRLEIFIGNNINSLQNDQRGTVASVIDSSKILTDKAITLSNNVTVLYIISSACVVLTTVTLVVGIVSCYKINKLENQRPHF